MTGFWADADSRAEIHLGSSAIRLASRTSVTVTNLDEHVVQVSVSEGTIGVHIRDLPAGHLVEVDTPTAAITLRGVGAYRITAEPSGNAAYIVVRRGAAEVLASGNAFEVAAHSLATITGEAAATSHVLAQEPASDGFDFWCDARDKREENPPALQYVSRDTVGYEDLDDNGAWQQSPEYGPVWTPQNVDPTWAPYQDGRWSWLDPWGWTWIDAAAWGYAPFHYGRWVRWGSRWGWAPGPIVRSPVYAPALVGFIGTAGFGYRDPLVGWFPLGWNECYVPGYYASYRYVRQLNASVVNIHNINLANIHNTQVYMNRGVPGAVTTVPRGVMQGAQLVSGHRVSAPSDVMNRAEVTGFTARVAPQMASVVASHAAQNLPPAGANTRPVVTHNAPAGAAVPFATRAAALQNSIERPVTNAPSAVRPSNAGYRANVPPRPTTPTPGSHPVAPTPHASVPPVIGPHNAPPRFSPPAVHYVQQPARYQGPTPREAPQPTRYQGPSYTSSPRYNAPTPHYSAPSPRRMAPATMPRYAPAGRVGGRR